MRFDDVLNDQRKTIFEQRLELMNAENISEIAKDMQYDIADEIVNTYCPEKSFADQWDLKRLKNEINLYFSYEIDFLVDETKKDMNQEDIKNKIYKHIDKTSQDRMSKHPKELVNNAERMVLLKILDDKWKDHINNLEQLRSTIGLRGYGQRDPLNEYKNEAFGLFEDLINGLKSDVTKIFSRMRIRENIKPNDLNETEQEVKAPTSEVKKEKKVSRNAPCPCGSGKKFKHCHGKII